MADIFSVIADPTRRHILELLLAKYVDAKDLDSPSDVVGSGVIGSGVIGSGVIGSGASTGAGTVGIGESSVSELVSALDLSQPTVSKHLKVLRDAGLAGVREEGQHRFYRLEAAALEEIEDWVIPFLSADFDGTDEGDSVATDESGWPELDSELSKNFATIGKTVGRTVAATSYQARTVVEDLQANATKLVSKLRKES
jgi:ArsR family transcriptional regulator